MTTSDPLIASEGAIVGFGRLVGPVEGEVSIRATDIDSVRITFSDISSGIPGARSIILGTSPDAVRCNNIGEARRAGTLEKLSDKTITASAPTPNEFMDLSNFKALALRTTSCDPATFSIALLSWNQPSALQMVKAVDKGRRESARGSVLVHAGHPSVYRVAPGDLLFAVASRFSLTPDELLWLNPFRKAGDSGQLDTGEGLYLDPHYRSSQPLNY